MFTVGRTYKTGFGGKVTIIAVLDQPDDDGNALIGLHVNHEGEREIRLFEANGAVRIGGRKSGLSLIPEPSIETQFVHPPIPQRQFDWCASWSDADENDPRRGWGPTEQSAIEDLKLMFPREDDPEPRFHLVDGEVEFK